MATAGRDRAGSSMVNVEPAPRAFALGADGPAVRLDELLHDGEAEAEAPVPARGRPIGLAEGLEEVREERRVDALAGVGDPDHDALAQRERPQGRRCPPSGVNLMAFDRTFQTTCCRRSASAAMIAHCAHVGREDHAPGLGLRAHRLERPLDRGGHVGRGDVEPELAADDARHVEDVLDDAGLARARCAR